MCVVLTSLIIYTLLCCRKHIFPKLICPLLNYPTTDDCLLPVPNPVVFLVRGTASPFCGFDRLVRLQVVFLFSTFPFTACRFEFLRILHVFLDRSSQVPFSSSLCSIRPLRLGRGALSSRSMPAPRAHVFSPSAFCSFRPARRPCFCNSFGHSFRHVANPSVLQ